MDRAAAERALRALRPLLARQGLALGTAAAGDPAAHPAGPGEERLAAGMLPVRRGDFLAGRRAARRALAAAGLPATAEILYEDGGRRPRPPAGCAASISHSGGLAVAVAAAGSRALGCDLELRGLPSEAARLVLSEDERPWAEGRLTAAFSAKEAAFKAYSALLPAADAPTSLLGIAARPVPGGFRTRPGRLPGPELEVRVRPAGPGVFSWTVSG
nr:phosphopantetheinyl transferase [Streptomyces sp.]